MTPDDPRHGEYAGAQAHAKEGEDLCGPCLEARRRYARYLSYDHDRGVRRRVPPQAAAEHIHRLREAGLSVREIAARAGVASGTINRTIGIGYEQPRVMEATRVAAILSVEVPSVPGGSGYLPALGVIRRIQALNAIGWSRKELAERLEMSGPNLTQMVNGCRRGNRSVAYRPAMKVQAKTWHKVADLYDELCMTPGPSNHARIYAAKKGWPPPLAWDDIDHDAAPAQGERVRHHDSIDHAVVERMLASGERPRQLTRAECAEITRRAMARGMSHGAIEELYGIKADRYTTPREDTAA